ncbi:MAG: hypothetical protein M3R25_15595 [Bacteroidota bacterium]|nr:hypothetical protein [Bacteroidota bacterium]
MRNANILLSPVFYSLIFVGIVSNCLSQNIVPNHSFETYTECPDSYDCGLGLYAPPWQCANAATTDYFNACANPGYFDVPDNISGYQHARTGDAYAGVYYDFSQNVWFEYLQVQLTEPMVAGLSYEVSFYVSQSEVYYCGMADMGVYFSEEPPPYIEYEPIDVDPQLISNMGYITNSQDWTLITGCYIAQGSEEWITIGNFNISSFDPSCGLEASYYYIDDVEVEQDTPDEIDVELGDMVIACDSFVIDPQIPDVNYHWEGGSTEPTLTVTESGTYSLTVTDGCDNGIGSLEVIILEDAEDVVLGPEEVSICNGESYDISLDPDVGDYVWQDGSTGPDYSITTGGQYQVSLDDGCDITSDEIIVNVLEEPAPFPL